MLDESNEIERSLWDSLVILRLRRKDIVQIKINTIMKEIN